MKIATWNVNGIRARKDQFLEWIVNENPDVVCLQEIKASPAQIPPEVCELPGYTCYWHGAGGYSGVGLHLRQGAFSGEPKFSHPQFDHETRIVQVEADGIVIASVYVPNGGKDFDAKISFMKELAGYAEAVHHGGRQLVVCGDLNVAHTDMDVHPKERKPNIIGQRPDERELFDKLLGSGLVDVTRKLHPDDPEFFTWWAPWRNMRQRNIGWRIDYILASAPLAAKATACSVYREVGTSDHAPLVVEFAG